MDTINLADAKSRLSELVSQVEAGEPVCITRHGRAVARLSAVQQARKPVNLAELQAITAGMPVQAETAGEFTRSMRDGDRY